MLTILVLSAIVVPVLDGALILSAFATCDVGINSGANLMAYALLEFPLVSLAVALAQTGVLRLTRGLKGAGVVLPLIAAAVGVSLVHLALTATPADYPAPLCPGNVPPWWPPFLPS
jgi:hypothetical protein